MQQPLITIASYLPQFHEIPENNAWWGSGFTEWTHLRNARKWSRRHAIRRPVAPLGEYSLAEPSTLELQWSLAAAHGLDGFAVWDYWFGAGVQLLQRPLEIVLSNKLNFKYCLAWANHSWWDKSKNRLLCEQKYLGASDYRRYFEYAERHFENENYLRVDGKPLFLIFEPSKIPDLVLFLNQWRNLAVRSGFPGVYFVGNGLSQGDPIIAEFDKYTNSFRWLAHQKGIVNRIKDKIFTQTSIDLGPNKYDFREMEERAPPFDSDSRFAPTVLTGWDTTPRHGRRGVVYENLDVDAVRRQLAKAMVHFKKYEKSPGMLILKSWNEWAEGNILEPDTVYGTEMLVAIKEGLAAYRDSWPDNG
jgi:hypothetical protein